MKIAVIILHFGKLATTEHCLKELAKKIENHSVILVNNTSDNLTSLTQIIPGTRVLSSLLPTPKSIQFSCSITISIFPRGLSAISHLPLPNTLPPALSVPSFTILGATTGEANTIAGPARSNTKIGITNPKPLSQSLMSRVRPC